VAEKKSRGKIATKVEEIIRGPVEEAGYLIWDVEYYKEGADYNLLVTIENPDRETPIGLDDCEMVSRLLSPLLDEADPIAESYYLEVSSAGSERELTRPEHFGFYLEKPVSLRLYAPRDGKKTVLGTLVSFEDGAITLCVDGENIRFSEEEAAKITTVDENL